MYNTKLENAGLGMMFGLFIGSILGGPIESVIMSLFGLIIGYLA